ncbi:MAG: sigma-70 family RNA polymerase sigma factor [Deltaproteobacteria bacterium]|nr:sigma-70 family RNA polymerase sigma factor [Deltaproteobacteria bacterium]
MSTTHAAFEQQALIHRKDLYAVALRYARNHGDAEDLVQETMMRALSAWDRFKPGTNCRAWLFRILTNSFINECRRLTRERRWVNAGDPVISPVRRRAAADPESVFVDGMLADEVHHALAALAPEFRQVVTLADLRGLSYRQIAKQLDCPLGTVMSRLYRARRQLESQLGDYAKEAGVVRAKELRAA